MRILHTLDPIVRPLCRFLGGLGLGILPHRQRIRSGVHVEKERADDFGPMLTSAEDDAGTPKMVLLAEKQNAWRRRRVCVAMGQEIGLDRTVADVFNARIDQPETHLLGGACPSIRAMVE